MIFLDTNVVSETLRKSPDSRSFSLSSTELFYELYKLIKLIHAVAPEVQNMASPKSRAGGRATTHRKMHTAAASMPATAFLVAANDGGRTDTVGFKLQVPSNTYQALADKPARVKALLQHYGQAVVRSREAGRRVSFRVDVDPAGAATMTPVEDTTSDSAYPIEETGPPGHELQEALVAARACGRLRAAEILGAEDMLSAEAFAAVLGTTRVTVNAKRQNGQVLGLDGAKRGFRFPLWQLDAEGKPFPELCKLHEQLGSAWAVYRFLVQPHGALGGLTGRQALAQGKSKAMLRAAEGFTRDFR